MLKNLTFTLYCCGVCVCGWGGGGGGGGGGNQGVARLVLTECCRIAMSEIFGVIREDSR